MSRRRELDGRLDALRDINGILRAMKNLALMEQQKLAKFLTTQRRVVDSIEAAAEDFFTFYPEVGRQLGKGTSVWLIIGSERGFCGDYNERLRESVEQHIRDRSPHQPCLVLIGRKLADKFIQDGRVAKSLAGPTVAEEVPALLIGLMTELRELQAGQKPGVRLEFTIVHQSPASEEDEIRVHEPMKRAPRRPSRVGYPPLLNLDPFVFATDLIDQHLFSLLHEVFYSSLMAENLRRFQHMDQAIQRLEKDMADLVLKRNGLRQEEITEEIEILMLSIEALRQ